MDTPYNMLLQSSIIFVRLGSIVGLIVGIGMLIGPKKTEQVNQLLSRPVGTGRIMQELNHPRWIERHFYAHHRIAGTALLIGAVVGLYAFIFSPKVHAFSRFFPRTLWWMWDATMIIMAAGSTLAVLVGLVMLVRPNLLSKIEQPANRWIDTDRFFMLFNTNRLFSDQFILRYRKIIGPLMIAACIYNLILLRHIH